MSNSELLQPGWTETTKLINGVELHVVEAGREGDPLLILLHGFPEFWWAWRKQIAPLAAAGYHVIVPDMRGYNGSSAPQEVAAYHLEVLAADVVALADAYGADRFDLVGHDWGAIVTWWTAATHPARLRRVVVMDGPHPDVWGPQAIKHPTQALRSTYVALFQLPWAPEVALGAMDFAGLKAMMTGSAHPDTFEEGALDRYAEAWAHPGSLSAMLNYYRALRERRGGSEPARLAPPTLILWAGDDRFLERNIAEAGLALCDDGRLVVVEGASHWLHIEQPERVNAKIIDFLGDRRPAGALTPVPFRIDVPLARLDKIREQVAGFDWDGVPDAGGWSAGVGLADLRRLVDHWLSRFDWRTQEAALNRLPQFTADIDGLPLHFVHARGNGAKGAILLLHGWPGSFVEFARLVEPLAANGFDVVVPSLPGYAFSGRSKEPIGPRATAELMHRLMSDTLGYDHYLVQGGDWGAGIGAWMAHIHPQAVVGLHLNMVLVQAKDALPKTKDELAWAETRAKLYKQEGGYSHEQETRPQTLGVALSDSPVGVAAWILEKFGRWSDLPKRPEGSPDLWARYDEDLLLTNIMLYLVTRAFPTSTWMYKGRVAEDSGSFPIGARVEVPTGVAAFPDPAFPPPPRSLAEKTYNVTRWTDMPEGGHFAALEQPELWLADVRDFARQTFDQRENQE